MSNYMFFMKMFLPGGYEHLKEAGKSILPVCCLFWLEQAKMKLISAQRTLWSTALSTKKYYVQNVKGSETQGLIK